MVWVEEMSPTLLVSSYEQLLQCLDMFLWYHSSHHNFGHERYFGRPNHNLVVSMQVHKRDVTAKITFALRKLKLGFQFLQFFSETTFLICCMKLSVSNRTELNYH